MFHNLVFLLISFNCGQGLMILCVLNGEKKNQMPDWRQNFNFLEMLG